MKENEVLLLRFKYHSFFDLNPKVRPLDKGVQLHLVNGFPENICRCHGVPECDSCQFYFIFKIILGILACKVDNMTT